MRSKVLNSFDLVAADKALDKGFVAALVAVENCLSGVEYLGEYGPRRPRGIDGHPVNYRDLLLSEEKYRLRDAIFQNFEIALAQIANRVIVAVNNANIKRDQFGIDLQRRVFVDFGSLRIGRLLFQNRRRWRRSQLRGDASAWQRLRRRWSWLRYLGRRRWGDGCGSRRAGTRINRLLGSTGPGDHERKHRAHANEEHYRAEAHAEKAKNAKSHYC